jgi:hypothetical protein
MPAFDAQIMFQSAVMDLLMVWDRTAAVVLSNNVTHLMEVGRGDPSVILRSHRMELAALRRLEERLGPASSVLGDKGTLLLDAVARIVQTGDAIERELAALDQAYGHRDRIMTEGL